MIILIILLVLIPFGIGAVIGAPYLPVLSPQAASLLELAELKPGQTIIDLGSGDGRFLAAAAKRGLNAIGYEINPFLYVVSLIVTWNYRRQVKIYLADFWQVNLPKVDAIYVFLIDRFMPKLDAKLSSEIKNSTPVISYVFAIPGRPAEVTTKNAFKYRYGS